jgi:2,4-dienoyl-CoA reductase-like NADH-dependent reductase (Old Yellow Enzyme family)/thioredoxin reductase
MTKLIKLFEPGKIGSMKVDNRFIMAPMGTHSSDSEGFLTDETADYYVERVKGGVGLIIAQSSQATRIGRAPGRPGAWHDKFIPSLAKVAEAVHNHGGKIAWQVLYHGKLLLQWKDEIPRPWEIRAFGPSNIPWVKVGEAPEEATPEDIGYLVDEWSEAARRIKDAGFDAVEIHGAHGYGITQWLSPRDNKRTDEYGGSPENRARFACELIARVREKVGPDFPIIFRFSGSDFMPDGISIEDSIVQAPLFVNAGADALHVSACEDETSQWQFLTYLFPDGAIVHLAEAIKKVVDVPVITVGKIWDPVFAEKILQENKADFVAMGRALLADPEIPKKAKAGRLEDIRRCIFCNNCLDRAGYPKEMGGKGRCCTVNPSLFRENDFVLKPASSPKKIMVIGGGIAGMEAAGALAGRGHLVDLYEKEDRLGGQFNIVSMQPGKDHYSSLVERQKKELKRVGVRIHLNTSITIDNVKDAVPDVVVVATGARSKILDVNGVDNDNVVQANDVITGNAKVGDSVLIAGGRQKGMEVAIQLAEAGKKVALTTYKLLGENGTPLERNIYRGLRNRLIENGIRIFENAPIAGITKDGAYIKFHNELIFLKADTVVLAVGTAPNNELVDDLKKEGFLAHVIGDCHLPRNALLAVREGAEVGRKI